MASQSTFEFPSEGVGVPVEGIVGVGAVLSVVMHTERLLDIVAVDLNDPPTFLGKRDRLGVRPVEAGQIRRLLADQGSEPFGEIPGEAGGFGLPHANRFTGARRGGDKFAGPWRGLSACAGSR